MNQALLEVIKQAVEWLDSEQDPSAVLTHHGIRLLRTIDHLHISLAPLAFANRPVFVFEDDRVKDPEWDGYTEEEIKAIRQTVERVHPVQIDWNGVGTFTYSVALHRFAGPGVTQAVENYLAAGPKIFEDDWWESQTLAVPPDGWGA